MRDLGLADPVSPGSGPWRRLQARLVAAGIAFDWTVDDLPRFMHSGAARLGWSGRGRHRALKLARTIAALAAAQSVQVTQVAEAPP